MRSENERWQPVQSRCPAPEMGWWWDRKWHLVAQGTRWPRTAPQGWHWWPSGWSHWFDDGNGMHHWNWWGEPRQILIWNYLELPGPPPALEWWWDGQRWLLVVENKPPPPYPPPAGWQWWWDGQHWNPVEGLPAPRRPAVDKRFIVAMTLLGGPLGALQAVALTAVDQVRGRVR